MHKYNVIYVHKKRMVFPELIFMDFINAQQQYICRPIVVNFIKKMGRNSLMS